MRATSVHGWERELCCAELGITCPREVRHFESEAAKFQFILAVNAHRRPNLNGKQKRAVIEAYLRGDPGVADNTLGEALAVSKNTVLAVRRRLEESGKIGKLTKTRGRDGKLRPVKYTKRIVTNTRAEFKKAQEIVKDLPETCAGKTLDITTARRRAASNRNKVEREDRRIVVPLPGDAIRLYHCRFQDLEQVAGLAPASTDLFLTDFPYGADFLDQLEDLAALARRTLVEGGLFVTYSGQFHLPQVIAAFGKHLTYRWTAASINAHANLVFPLNILSQQKPILIYSNGEWRKRGRFPDVLWGRRRRTCTRGSNQLRKQRNCSVISADRGTWWLTLAAAASPPPRRACGWVGGASAATWTPTV
jgi:hypothetical protein